MSYTFIVLRLVTAENMVSQKILLFLLQNLLRAIKTLELLNS